MAFGAILLGAAFVVIVVLVLWRPIFVVAHDEMVAVKRLGRPHRILQPGLRWIWPLFEQCHEVSWQYPVAQKDAAFVDYRLPHREITLPLQPVDCVTALNQRCDVKVSLTFMVTEAQKAAYVAQLFTALDDEVAMEVRNAFETLAATTIDRARLAAAVKSRVGELGWQQRYGVTLRNISVTQVEVEKGRKQVSFKKPVAVEMSLRPLLALLKDSGLSDPVLVAVVQNLGPLDAQ